MSLFERVASKLPEVFLEQQLDNRVDGVPNLLGPGILVNGRIVELVLEALGFVTCQTCDGDGECVINPTGRSTFNHLRKCPDCLGLGVVPSDKMIDRAAKAYIERWVQLKPHVNTKKCVNAALLAAIGEKPDA